MGEIVIKYEAEDEENTIWECISVLSHQMRHQYKRAVEEAQKKTKEGAVLNIMTVEFSLVMSQLYDMATVGGSKADMDRLATLLPKMFQDAFDAGREFERSLEGA